MKFLKNRSSELYDLAIKSGYDICGIISIEDTADYKNDLDKRIGNIPEARDFYEEYYSFAKMKERYP